MTEDLFGNAVDDTTPAEPSTSRPVTNDMTAVMTVLGHAHSVLVPKATCSRLSRWRALKYPLSWTTTSA